MVRGDHGFPTGMLSDNDIKSFWGKGINIFSSEIGELKFDLEKQLQLGSVDLHFRHEYKKIKLSSNEILSYDMLKQHDYTTPFELKTGETLRIAPGEMVLTTTLETVQFSEEFAGIITGRSSIARLGIMVHCCQEYINPGHGQPIPLQLINLAPCTVELDVNVPICQLVIFRLHTPSSSRYKDDKDAKYATEIGPQGSKIYEEVPSRSQDNIKGDKNKWLGVRNFLSKYLLPFLPTLIMCFLFTSFINNYINGRSLFDIVAAVKAVPITTILGLVFLILYFWIKRGNKS